ncbi:hypothetical protein BCJMU51_0925 [Bacillus cereus]|nr:hypothetical protein BCM0045_0950 [Bacillus cereus]BCB98867.1 hypothetical protein BCM0057_0950 [Bacillus cereus]BCC22363.1 hypothetical protein BCM0079_0956 [Bacillus cereus]BCC33971.1 hypothetical protein BCM0105_0961 [Bacillus cereus]BCC39756.1 hypothetical protein BCJMU01_0923 [Bacillus cereus]
MLLKVVKSGLPDLNNIKRKRENMSPIIIEFGNTVDCIQDSEEWIHRRWEIGGVDKKF